MVSKPNNKSRGRAKPKKSSKPKGINQRFIESSARDSLKKLGTAKLKQMKYNAIDDALSVEGDIYYDEWEGKVFDIVAKDLEKDIKKFGLSPSQYKEIEGEAEDILSDYLGEKLSKIKVLY